MLFVPFTILVSLVKCGVHEGSLGKRSQCGVLQSVWDFCKGQSQGLAVPPSDRMTRGSQVSQGACVQCRGGQRLHSQNLPNTQRHFFLKKDTVTDYFWLAVWFWAAYINTLPWPARRMTQVVLIKKHLIGITLLLVFWPFEARMWTCKPVGGPTLSHPLLTQRMCQSYHPSDLNAPCLVLLVPMATISFSGCRSLFLRFWGGLTQSLLQS